MTPDASSPSPPPPASTRQQETAGPETAPEAPDYAPMLSAYHRAHAAELKAIAKGARLG
jgi:hypothetical protein